MKTDNKIQMKHMIEKLFQIVRELEQQYPGRHFTLDGHLVGSIGEVLAAQLYDLTLLTASSQTHDAIASDGKMVQIKATQISRIGLTSEPDYLLVLKILPDGEVEEIYNGPGLIPWRCTGKMQKNGQRIISLSKLRDLSVNIELADRVR